MPLIRSPEREADAKTVATSVLLALQWSMRLLQGRRPLQARFQIGLRDASHIDRQYLAYLNAVDTSHCRNCRYGESLRSCATEGANSPKPYWCPLRASARKLAGVLVTESIRVENSGHYQQAQLRVELPARNARPRQTADVASHLGP